MSSNQSWDNLGRPAKGALIACGTFISLGFYAIGAALPMIASAFREDPHVGLMVQLIGGSAASACALASPIAGILIARFGVRRMFLGSNFLFILAGVTPVACTSLAQILICRIVLGIGVAGALTAGLAGITRCPERDRHRMLGAGTLIGSGAGILIFPLTGLLAHQSWRLAFLIYLLALPPALLALYLPTDPIVRKAAQPDRTRRGKVISITLLVVCGIAGWAIVANAIYSPFYLGSIGIQNPSTVGLILGAAAVCSMLGAGTYGRLQQTIGTRGAVCFALGCAALGCIVIGIFRLPAVAILGLGLLSAGLAIFGAAGYALAAEDAPEQSSSDTAMGLVTLALFGPQFLFPLISTRVSERFGPSGVFLALGLALIAALSAIAAARRSPRALAA